MVLATINYGTFVTHTGNLGEVMGAMKGAPVSSILSITGNTDLTSFVAVQKYLPSWLNGNDK